MSVIGDVNMKREDLMKGNRDVDVNLSEATTIMLTMANQVREDLKASLDSDSRDFKSQAQLLLRYQGFIRSLDVLNGLCDVEGNALALAALEDKRNSPLR